MPKGDTPSPEKNNREVVSAKDSAPQVAVSFEDLTQFASTIKEQAKTAVDSAAQFFGMPEIFDAAEAKPVIAGSGSREGEVLAGGAAGGAKQGKPVIDFDPSSGGGCFGEIQAPRGKDRSGGKVISVINDWKKTDNADVKDISKTLSVLPDSFNGMRPEVEKRARFEDAMKDMAKAVPEGFEASQELMQAAFKAAQTGNIDVNQMRDLAQRAAREFAQNPSGEAAQRMRAISEQLHKDYGINISIGQKGVEISNEAEGDKASLIRFDQHGNMTARADVAPGGNPHSVSAEEALGNIARTRRQHALDNSERGVVEKVIPTDGKVLRPSEPSPMEKPLDKGGPIKVYEQALQEAERLGHPVVIRVGR
ncbi:MAG: hypothetical protein K2Y39_27680 [Candidatus Obscuribacterales bacterium]|nr:hypothetical protein [Candidatus Obscuribacterales bacterium]